MKESASRTMPTTHRITFNGKTFTARRGELLLDAALKGGVDIPYDCRAGHCGTCCVRLVSGAVHGGEGVEPGVVHACQCRISGDAVVERGDVPAVRSVSGILRVLRPLSAEVMEAGIATDRALPYLPGQYVQVQFDGFPSRPFSITHTLRGPADGRMMFFHMRRMASGRVTRSLGAAIEPGHGVTLTGPFGAAHFRPQTQGRLVLVGTNTGFAPIWSIAVAALREDPARAIVIVAGGRGMQALYMGPALAQLSRFANVRIVPVCSGTAHLPPAVKPGRPTDHLPPLMPGDQVYACGAQAMVEQIKAVAARAGAICYADPFVAAAGDVAEDSLLTRAKGWLTLPTGLPLRRALEQRGPDPRESGRREPAMPSFQMAEARVKRHLGS
jgi:3-phenylpropionate/trans-cinnamate dioxygenase ferredoxin reductase subunit